MYVYLFMVFFNDAVSKLNRTAEVISNYLWSRYIKWNIWKQVAIVFFFFCVTFSPVTDDKHRDLHRNKANDTQVLS